MTLGENKAYAVEGVYLYILNGERGLIKAQCTSTNCPGKIIKINPEVRGQSMVLFKGQLYVRNADDKPLPFKIYDADSLERVEIEDEEKRYEPPEGETRSIQWTELNEDTGRQLGATPLITDGTYLYVVSLQQKTKAEKEKVSAVSGEDDKPKLVVEIYDPNPNKSEKNRRSKKDRKGEAGSPEQQQGSAYKFVRQVTLYKNEHKTLFCKHDNKPEIFSHTEWATNGQHLLCFYKGKAMLFDLETGVREVKERIQDDGEDGRDPLVSAEDRWTYDQQTNVFTYVYSNESMLHAKTCSFSHFKPPRASGSTLSALETLEKSINEANKEASVPNLSTLSVFDRLIQNVTNSDLAANEKQRQSKSPFDQKDLLSINSAVILKYLNDKYPDFEQHYHNVSQGDSKEYRDVIQTFRYPNVCSLTSNFMRLIKEHLGFISTQVASSQSYTVL
jgi:hypothetical protein